MLDYLYSLDISLFRFINGSLSNSILDVVMPFMTNLTRYKLVLLALAVLLLFMLIRGKPHVRIAAVLLIVTIAITDQLNSFVLKFWMERPRPCHTLHSVHLLVGCGSGYAFPSSHAVNNFAGAVILAFFFPRAKWWFIGYAALISFSRIYVGVHYPSDVLAGAVIGACCAGTVLSLFLVGEHLWYRIRGMRIHPEIPER